MRPDERPVFVVDVEIAVGGHQDLRHPVAVEIGDHQLTAHGSGGNVRRRLPQHLAVGLARDDVAAC